jgi:NAD(P) transhydrogenase subunit alpha
MDLVTSIVIFTLATFLGVELIGRVPPTLHTPLMSGANAVSGITVVGALIVAGGGGGTLVLVLAFVAIVLAMMNVVGGYAVTDRMLEMFKSKQGNKR